MLYPSLGSKPLGSTIVTGLVPAFIRLERPAFKGDTRFKGFSSRAVTRPEYHDSRRTTKRKRGLILCDLQPSKLTMTTQGLLDRTGRDPVSVAVQEERRIGHAQQ